MVRRSVVVFTVALAALLALAGTVTADHGEPHGGRDCLYALGVEVCTTGGSGGNTEKGTGGGGGGIKLEAHEGEGILGDLLLGAGVSSATGGRGSGGNTEKGTGGGGGGGCIVNAAGERSCGPGAADVVGLLDFVDD